MTRSLIIGGQAVLFGAALCLPGQAFAGQHHYQAQHPTYHQGQHYDAHAECKRAEDRRQLLGGAAGAIGGAVLGSQISGNGARTEGSYIGALIGGLAGAGVADKTIDCDAVYGRVPSHSPYYGQTRQSHQNQYSYSQPVHKGPYTSGTQAYAPTVSYPARTVVSTHPVYQNPSWGARPAHNQPLYRTNYTDQTHARSHVQPRQYHQSGHTVQKPTVYRPERETVPYQSRPVRPHFHGRFACIADH